MGTPTDVWVHQLMCGYTSCVGTPADAVGTPADVWVHQLMLCVLSAVVASMVSLVSFILWGYDAHNG